MSQEYRFEFSWDLCVCFRDVRGRGANVNLSLALLHPMKDKPLFSKKLARSDLRVSSLSDHPPIEKVDMIVAISATATRKEENFQKARDVVQSIISEYGRERLHYGVILFGKPPRTAVRLSDSFDTDNLLMDNIVLLVADTYSADLAEVGNMYLR